MMDKLFSPQTYDMDDSDTSKCNFDIILGHSQGAILTAALLSKHNNLWKSSDGPVGYILNGVAWPNPYNDSLMSLAHKRRGTILPRILFIMGKEDTMNPIESAMQVHDAFQAAKFNISIVEHDRGHSVPTGSDENSIKALEEIVDWIVDIAKEKVAKLEK